jgi:hypothetical protein
MSYTVLRDGIIKSFVAIQVAATGIEKPYFENRDLLDYLQQNKQVSFRSQLDDTFKKVLLLACASNLEHQVTDILTEFAATASNNCTPLVLNCENTHTIL